jgi:hypothetical protein
MIARWCASIVAGAGKQNSSPAAHGMTKLLLQRPKQTKVVENWKHAESLPVSRFMHEPLVDAMRVYAYGDDARARLSCPDQANK